MASFKLINTFISGKLLFFSIGITVPSVVSSGLRPQALGYLPGFARGQFGADMGRVRFQDGCRSGRVAGIQLAAVVVMEEVQSSLSPCAINSTSGLWVEGAEALEYHVTLHTLTPRLGFHRHQSQLPNFTDNPRLSTELLSHSGQDYTMLRSSRPTTALVPASLSSAFAGASIDRKPGSPCKTSL